MWITVYLRYIAGMEKQMRKYMKTAGLTASLLMLGCMLVMPQVALADTPASAPTPTPTTLPQPDMSAPGIHGFGTTTPTAKEQFDRMSLAFRLTAYGQQSNAPEALITAAKILKANPNTANEKPGKIAEMPDVTPTSPRGLKKAKLLATPPQLLTAAKQMSHNDPHIVALAMKVEKQPDAKGFAAGGPQSWWGAPPPSWYLQGQGYYYQNALIQADAVSDGNSMLTLQLVSGEGVFAQSAPFTGYGYVSGFAGTPGVYYVRCCNVGNEVSNIRMIIN